MFRTFYNFTIELETILINRNKGNLESVKVHYFHSTH